MSTLEDASCNDPELEIKAEDLTDCSMVILRAALEESSELRQRVLHLLMERLTKEEIRTLVKDVGIGGFKKVMRLL